MSTALIFEQHCSDSSATEAFAERFARKLRGGEVIDLVGDVGSGKTTFVKGLARGLDSPDHVSSPTFTISQVYDGRLPLHHFDFYRLDEGGITKHQLAESSALPEAVVVVEWSQIARDVLPDARITISFQAIDENNRLLSIKLPAELDYLGSNA